MTTQRSVGPYLLGGSLPARQQPSGMVPSQEPHFTWDSRGNASCWLAFLWSVLSQEPWALTSLPAQNPAPLPNHSWGAKWCGLFKVIQYCCIPIHSNYLIGVKNNSLWAFSPAPSQSRTWRSAFWTNVRKYLVPTQNGCPSPLEHGKWHLWSVSLWLLLLKEMTVKWRHKGSFLFSAKAGGGKAARTGQKEQQSITGLG